MEDIKLIGYIAGAYVKRGNSHFANLEGNVICGTKNMFGMDCSIEIRFTDFDNFYTDQTLSFKFVDKLNIRKNNLPLNSSITCKKCLKKLHKILTKDENDKL